MEPAHGFHGACPNALLPQIVEWIFLDWQAIVQDLQFGAIAL